MKQSVFDEFEFRNNEISKLKWKIEVNSYNQPFILSFDPPTGLLGKVIFTLEIPLTQK